MYKRQILSGLIGNRQSRGGASAGYRHDLQARNAWQDRLLGQGLTPLETIGGASGYPGGSAAGGALGNRNGPDASAAAQIYLGSQQIKTQKEIAEIQAQTARDVATIQIGGQISAAGTAAGASDRRAVIGARATGDAATCLLYTSPSPRD